MSDVWTLFIDKINKFNKNIALYSFSIIKNILSYSKLFSKSSIDKIEINKLTQKNKNSNPLKSSVLSAEKLGHIFWDLKIIILVHE